MVSKKKAKSPSAARSRTGVRKKILLSILGLLVFAALTYIFWLPDVRPLRDRNPTSTSLTRSRGDSAPKFEWVKYDDIPTSVRQAVLISEDQNFWHHSGVDFRAVWNALKQAVIYHHRPHGASTITQQLAKNLYLSESYNPLRKIKELLIARRLENTLPKYRILELYLNVIEWGPHLYGLKPAGEYYLKKPPAQLSLADAAYLVAIIPSPLGVFNPKSHLGAVLKRQQLLMREVNHKGRLLK